MTKAKGVGCEGVGGKRELYFCATPDPLPNSDTDNW
jgi:hypothetical protein